MYTVFNIAVHNNLQLAAVLSEQILNVFSLLHEYTSLISRTITFSEFLLVVFQICNEIDLKNYSYIC